MLAAFRDYREPRDWARPWRDPPGYGWGWCCCPCSSPATKCFRLVLPLPDLSGHEGTDMLCGFNNDAWALLIEAVGGVLKVRSPLGYPCVWTSIACGQVAVDGGSDPVYNGYALSMRSDGCRVLLEVYQACGIDLEDCCNADTEAESYPPHVSPGAGPIAWELVTRYEVDKSDFDCDGETEFTKVIEEPGSDACLTCEVGGVNSTFPETLTIERIEGDCPEDTLGGDQCEGSEFDDCCNISTRSGNLFVTITSSCPQFDGLALTLQRSGITWFSLGAVLGTEPLASDCHGDNLNGTCKIDSLILICDPSDGSWSFTMAGSCQMDPTGACSFTMVNSSTDLTHDAPPDTITCDPLSMTFTKYIYEPGGSPCSGCVTCEITLTVTE